MTVQPRIAIIGVGSPYGDDSLGWRAVEWLAQCGLGARHPRFELSFSCSDRPGALLLEQLRGVEGAVLIDAMQSGLPPATVRQFAPEQLAADDPLLSSHGFGVAAALALGQALATLPRHLSIIGIEMGEGSTVEGWQPALIRAVEGSLAEWLAVPCQ